MSKERTPASLPTARGRLTMVALEDESRLTFKRLRRPTPLPSTSSATPFGRYLDRLGWIFGSR